MALPYNTIEHTWPVFPGRNNKIFHLYKDTDSGLNWQLDCFGKAVKVNLNVYKG